MPGLPVPSHTTYRHEALFYRGLDQLLSGTVPFIADGLSLGEPTMVAVASERLEPLRAALGSRADEVRWVDMAELGGNPARIIPAWQEFLDEHGGGRRPVRGVGEPVWAGRRPAELVECQLHEALLNLAVEPSAALWLRCPYDTGALAEDVLVEAARSHPAIVDRESYRGSTLYGGAAYAADLFASELPEPDVEVEEWQFGHLWDRTAPHPGRDVAGVRSLVEERAVAAGLTAARRADLALAVTEAANNCVRHAGGRGTLRMWQDGDGLTCEISDRGHIIDPLVGRHVPAPDKPDGRGLWLANQLSDLLQVRSTPQGSTVRITCWR